MELKNYAMSYKQKDYLIATGFVLLLVVIILLM